MYREKHPYSLTSLFFQAAEAGSSREALRDEQGMVDYAALAGRVKALALSLIEAGLKPGDRVAFLFPNSIDYVTVHYAVMSAGGVSVPMDNFISGKNLKFQLEDTEARFFLFDRSHWSKLLNLDLPDLDFVAGNGKQPDGEDSPFRHVADMNQLIARGKSDSLPEVKPEHRAMIIYTTGTTGRQKGVSLSHQNLVISAMNIMEVCEVTADDCELTALPQTRLFGLAHIHGYLSLGARMMLVKNLILPQKVLPLIEEIGATSFPNVPTAFTIMMDQYGELLKRYGSQLRYILMCSAPCKPERYKQLKSMLPDVRIFHSYGLTEAARTTIIELDKHTDRLTSVGAPTPGMHVSIVKDDKAQPPGETGEVVISGPIVTEGYWKLPEENKRVFSKHGFHTGDMGKQDDDGHLFLVGRIKDIINVSGLKVNPAEIEDVLLNMSEIRDVAVVGFPDQTGSLNEKIAAFYVSADGRPVELKKIRDFCSKHLEQFKLPVHAEQIDQVPKTVSGKIQRNRLRESYQI